MIEKKKPNLKKKNKKLEPWKSCQKVVSRQCFLFVFFSVYSALYNHGYQQKAE